MTANPLDKIRVQINGETVYTVPIHEALQGLATLLDEAQNEVDRLTAENQAIKNALAFIGVTFDHDGSLVITPTKKNKFMRGRLSLDSTQINRLTAENARLLAQFNCAFTGLSYAISALELANRFSARFSAEDQDHISTALLQAKRSMKDIMELAVKECEALNPTPDDGGEK